MEVIAMNETMEHVERRRNLLALIKDKYPQKSGSLFLCAGFERDREVFYQDSSFHYFFGLQEPAVMIYQPLGGETFLYTPDYTIDRNAWLPETMDAELLTALSVDKIEKLGKPVAGYSTGPFFTKEALENLSAVLKIVCQEGGFIFTPLCDVATECRWIIEQLCTFTPELRAHLIGIDDLIAELRQTKSSREIEYLYHAAEITAMAQQAAAGVIRKNQTEADVQAALEFVFTESGATRAFTSIVGSGKNSTILHYTNNSALLPENGLVVVDIGASFNHYCSDVTRTYPVSGSFSARQKKVYQDVLDTQSYIADLARPGMYLKNKNHPKICLNTLAHEFLQKRGYAVETEFPHGIGHFVGLDVHDVGDYNKPLEVGDIITIEPGIYLRTEELGVRIEDVYWIVNEGAVCLTEEIPKGIRETEEFMRNSRFDEGQNEGNQRSLPDEH